MGSVCHSVGKLIERRPRPTLGQLGQSIHIDGGGFFVGCLLRVFPLRAQAVLPATTALGADALQQHVRGFHVRVGGAPVLREVAAEGSGEDGALELLQQRRQAFEAGLRGAAPLEDGVEFVDDAALLVERREVNGKFEHRG
jgi:hypothetical protein